MNQTEFAAKLKEKVPAIGDDVVQQTWEAVGIYASAHDMAIDEVVGIVLDAVGKLETVPQLEGNNLVFDVSKKPGRQPAAQFLTAHDVSEMQEAARQLSVMTGCSPRSAMTKLMKYGRRTGKISRHVKQPRSREHEEKRCLNCGTLKRHSNSFCSGECCKAWKANSKVKDRNGRTIRPKQMVNVDLPFEDGTFEYEVTDVFPERDHNDGYMLEVATPGGILGVNSKYCEVLGWADECGQLVYTLLLSVVTLF